MLSPLTDREFLEEKAARNGFILVIASFLIGPITKSFLSPIVREYASRNAVRELFLLNDSLTLVYIFLVFVLSRKYAFGLLKIWPPETRATRFFFAGVFLYPVLLAISIFLLSAGANLSLREAIRENHKVELILTMPAIYILHIMCSAFWEELLFRGLIQGSLNKLFGFSAALIVGSVFFSVPHLQNGPYPWHSFIMAYLAGLVLGWVYQRTQSLVFSGFLHSLYNLLSVFLALLVSRLV
ncbi:MAG: CPBP family intramembrane metalloprotease [Firmicutes bacterium]|nr:CPBP family intramembrane metalloprotease [Bacillota bacterium]MCL5038431.1 CPBP family intramembrane metalloprotease [Bacillota bacterium]